MTRILLHVKEKESNGIEKVKKDLIHMTKSSDSYMKKSEDRENMVGVIDI